MTSDVPDSLIERLNQIHPTWMNQCITESAKAALGKAYGVSPRTVSRWITKVRNERGYKYTPCMTYDKVVYEVNNILREYGQSSTHLTVRQLYYQLVLKQIIENTQNQYKQFDGKLTRARERGEIDDRLIVDHTRRIIGGDEEDMSSEGLDTFMTDHMEDFLTSDYYYTQ